MTKKQLVIYTDNSYATLPALAETECTIGIQAFISGATFTNGKCDLTADWPMGQAIKASPNGSTPVKEAQQKDLKVLAALGGADFVTAVWQECNDNLDSFVAALADFVKTNGFDGIDIDWEDSAAIVSDDHYNAVNFLVSLSQKLKAALPSDQSIITHAPQPPYLDPTWYGGPYLKVMEQAHDVIDYLNIQYYNNSPWVGDTPADETRLVAGTTGNPPQSTSIVGLQKAGIPAEKLLVGKPTAKGNAGPSANNGYIPAEDLVEYVIDPLNKAEQEFGGAMGWQFAKSPESPDLATEWISTVADALDLKDKK
ncbi:MULTISPECIES: glycosyl hydrolase family 18 protein [unclassified Pseudovibrio]|uniref:glycosyl hydrolase family 18 protein n=1 Tax=unclassified Pseudovibrio TaxID=2627060 RepID=UPI0007AE69AA|nr:MULTISPECIES: glycosyl hydrolase family 18 protein [unclassified Pseudovibrio]KZK97551.1 Chitinase D precursor [Pseudovibrio sp. W74]KZL04745.1 Chitinase D precursor [Pseudovibrio sp. Ad14]